MSRRQAGPPTATAVRTAGDSTIAKRLADALVCEGSVDRATHGFHTYPARMHPDAAASIIDLCPGPVHDPFCGGGTVLVEARLAGRAASGMDLSAIATLVAQARTTDSSLASPMRSRARKITEAAQLRVDVEVPESLERWYQPHVAQELGRIRDAIAGSDEAVQPLLRALLSSIVVKASFRQSDTHNRRETHHRPPGTTAILFHKKARELGRALESLPDGPSPIIQLGDAGQLAPPQDCGLILTSPPYPGVYDYLPMQQLRHEWLGIDGSVGANREVGARRAFRSLGRKPALAKWRQDTDRWIVTQTSRLASGGRFVIIVGDGLVGDKMVDALGPTTEALRQAGFKVIARASADRPDHARRAVRIEHIVLAERPGG